jgi:hypothetical protein
LLSGTCGYGTTRLTRWLPACIMLHEGAEMPILILEPADIARYKFVKGEIEAGLVFAANAIEYQGTNPTRAAAFRADAQDCYATAINLLRQAGSIQGWPQELEIMLDELQRRLGLLRSTKLVSSVAA